MTSETDSYIGEEYMAVGGLALPKNNLKLVTDLIKSLHKDPQREEIKWQTTKHWNIETAYRNGRHIRFETSAAKSELATYAHDAFRITDLTQSRDDGMRLSIWNVVPQKRGPRG